MQIQKCYKKQLLKIYELQIIGKLYLQLVQGWWEGFLNPVGAQWLHHQLCERWQ